MSLEPKSLSPEHETAELSLVPLPCPGIPMMVIPLKRCSNNSNELLALNPKS